MTGFLLMCYCFIAPCTTVTKWSCSSAVFLFVHVKKKKKKQERSCLCCEIKASWRSSSLEPLNGGFTSWQFGWVCWQNSAVPAMKNSLCVSSLPIAWCIYLFFASQALTQTVRNYLFSQTDQQQLFSVMCFTTTTSHDPDSKVFPCGPNGTAALQQNITVMHTASSLTHWNACRRVQTRLFLSVPFDTARRVTWRGTHFCTKVWSQSEGRTTLGRFLGVS